MNNDRKSIDIALAVYNGARFLPEFLESLDRQSDQNWQLICRDDASQDNSLDILRDFQKNHPDGKVVIIPSNGENLGVINNFNSVLLKCGSPYILLADQDDIWLPEKIALMREQITLIEQEIGNKVPILVHSDSEIIDAGGKRISKSLHRHQKLHPAEKTNLKNLLVQNTVSGCTAIINQALSQKALPIPDKVKMHDWWLALTAVAAGRLEYLDKPLVKYRQHDENREGAFCYNPGYIFKTFINGLSPLKEKIRTGQHQAKLFFDRFEKELSEADRKIVEAYSSLPSKGFLASRFIAAKYKFHKSGICRTAGFYLALK